MVDIFHRKVKFLMNLTSYILEPTFLTNVYHFVPPVPVNFHKHTVCLQENIFENTLKWSQTTSSSSSDTCHNLGVFLGLEMLLETDLGGALHLARAAEEGSPVLVRAGAAGQGNTDQRSRGGGGSRSLRTGGLHPLDLLVQLHQHRPGGGLLGLLLGVAGANGLELGLGQGYLHDVNIVIKILNEIGSK